LRYKQQVREKLRSVEGYALSVRRMIEPESVSGQIKKNRGFRRFLLRGLPKVSLEVGWLPIAHNLLKKAAIDQKSEMAVQGCLPNAAISLFFAYFSQCELFPKVSEPTFGTVSVHACRYAITSLAFSLWQR